MSEGDVSRIRDEDLLRRMWQQTEDFGRKKEIRAHMYRLREERLRSLYSPDPAPDTKGCEFTSAQKHVSSFADQTFQSMKSKEVRDAGSPPKEFTYRGQDLKELSNAGWNVESENRRTDDGRTHVKSVNANIEGQYDVEGGRGQFAAVDRQRKAVTEYQDDNTKLRRDETSSNTAAHEHIVRQTDDGTRISSTTSSSNTSSGFQQVSSSVHETAPRPIHDYDQHDTNRNEHVTRTTNTCDYEQNLRTNEFQSGELVSRKINYPDDNTKVIIETRCLPDGTRVTSTRREFHAPVQSTRSEYKTRSESKYNSQQQSDTRESSKVIRHTASKRTDDIVDSQRHVDDNDFRRQLREYVVDDDTTMETQSTNQRHETKANRKVSDHSQTTDDYQTSHETIRKRVVDESRNIRDAHHQTNQYFTDSVDQTDRREIIETFDNRNISQKDINVSHLVKDTEEILHISPKTTSEPEYKTPRDVGEPSRNVPKIGREPGHNISSVEPNQIFPKDTNEPHFQKVVSEQIHIVNKDRKTVDKKLEEVIERKSSSEHYQTTYHTDYQQKKVSNDWSPTHQAWASTLRGDTPSTTRPSTRASSPGSKTFKSSTSSLRSSVSPDKGFRKPSSRGGSPTKVDRCSPTRSVTSDRYSSTHSTHSTIESRTNKCTSPERKPPTGRSPTRSGESPDRKPQDHYRQRQSASPEKQPHNLANRFNTSPDRYSTKNTDYTTDNGSAFRPSVSPQRKPINDDSKPLFARSSKSPDRKKPDGSLKKLEGSPEREVGYRQPTPTREPFNSPKRLSVSPDRKPGFMRPTVASQPTHDTRKPSKPVDDLGSTDHKNIQSKVIEDHYKSITEETKTHSRTDKNHSVAHVKATSPSRKSPDKDISPSNGLPSPQKTKGRSPSPQKKKVMVSENDELYGRIDTTTKIDVINKYDKHTEDAIKRTSNETSKDNNTPSRDTSPTKFGTYDKKKQRDVPVSDVSPRDENSPNKKVSAPRSPTKQSPRNSTSPLKTQDAKYKYTTDFISTEKTIEEVNKKTVTKERPRQLVTPSASPTRQPKIETEPSTGQSSPTTSVSGFVYFGSPQTETVVTDLDDDFEAGTDYPVQSQSFTRPETLDVQRSQSPSKIPCRSPSPEKRDSSTADSLPRKSSLKKPSNYIAPVSPMEKPPSSFRISPTEDKPIEPEHKIVKKDNPDEPEVSTPMKTKPPLNRRETYEDRCRLILGMVDTATTENITKEIKQIKKKTESDKSSPDSPCDSPILRESSPFVNIPVQQKVSNIQTDVTDFISKEKDDLNKTAHDNNSNREPTLDSPTNLPKFKNEESKTLTITQVDTTQKRNKEGFSKTESKYESRRLNSPEKLNSRSIESPERQNRQKSQVGKPTSIVPNAESPEGLVHGNSPSRLPHPSISPERKQPVKENPNKNEQQKTGYKITSYEETITTENTEFDATDFLEEKTQVTKEKSPRTRVLESPNRQIPKSSDRVPSVESPSRPRVAETSPTRRNNSPDLHHNRESSHIKKQDRQHPEMSSPSEVRQSPQKVPGCMKNTTAISSKYENTSSTIDIEQTNTSKTVENKHKSVSPTSKHSQELPRSDHPAKPSQPNTKRHNEDSPERKLPKDAPIKLKPTDSSSNLPGYLKKTASTISKHDSSTTVSENISEHTTKKIVERKHSSGSPTRKVSQEPRTPSPSKFTRQPSVTSSPKKPDVSPERKPAYKQPSSPSKDKESKRSKDNQTSERSPSRVTADKTLSSQNRTVDYETVEVVQGTITTKTNQKQHVTSRVSESPSRETPKRNESPRKKPEKDFPNPSDITRQSDDALMYNKHEITASVQTSHISEPHKIPSRTISPERKPSNKIPTKETPTKLTQNSTEKINPMRSSVSPEKKPSYMKPTASVISKLESMSTTVEPHTDVETTKTVDHMKHHSPSRQSPPRQSSVKPIKDNSDHHTEYEEPRQLRTPSPSKKTMKITEVSTDFLMSEREQEILDRVHKSLRKLSPERKEKSPSREKSPNKTTTSLQDLDITTTECIETHQLKTDITDTLDVHVMDKTSKTYLEKPKADKHKEQKVPIKPTLRNVSPIKKTPVTTTPSKVDKTPESPTKSRSISPRKQLSQTDRPQSPQTPRASGIRPKDQVPLIRKPTPATLSTYKIEKLAPDAKKTNGITKQNVTPKTTMTSKTTSRIVSPHTTKPSETETRRIPTPKSIKDNISPRKEPVTRTSSDGNIKSKKTSPQRMKSKPEIQVNDISPRSSKYHKTIIKEPYSKLPAKPKSATALNTSTDEDDVIVDVQQSKSSRENSPDRICPTPVNFADDVGTPRFPDEVSEPDDEYRRQSYHTIHETESVVDDIVEICEDEELFVKKTNTSTEYDDSLLSVNDKVNKYTNKISYVSNPKDTTTTFKDTERKVHSDFTNDNMKSDECLLSVSEKVNKFAKGPRETRDSRSPSRKITDEYDKTTNYQDDYTKLSVNDKAHLFVETAENSKLPKLKMASKVDRPDLSNVDESLKKDDCLLSVSDKVSKFVKTAENYLTETQKVEQKERKIKEQHEKIIQQIVDEDEYDAEDTYAIDETTTKTFEKHVENSDNTSKPFNTETTTHSKVKDYSRPSVKPIDRTPIVKITTLRSSEAVKKAKALFENIASTQKPKDVTQTAKTTKLTDIGVVKKSPKTDSTIVLHPSVEDISPNVTDVVNEVDASPQAPHTTYQHPSGPLTRPHHSHVGEKSRSSPTPLTTQSPEVPRAKSPLRQNVETKSTKNILSRYPGAARSESPSHGSETQGRPEQKPEKVPGYLRPTKTSQIKEETKIVEETEVSTRRGSGKFGVELRRTSIERSTVSSERRRSVEHHQPCIEDIFDLDLLEQMLEKVVGYEQRRRIRSQIRVVKKETEHVDTHAYAKTKHTTTASKPKLPEQVLAKAPEHLPKSRTPQRTLSPQRQSKTSHSHPKEPATAVMNGHPKEIKTISSTHLRPQSPEKPGPKSIRPAKSPVRHLSPDKKRTVSPSKTIKLKENRFNEYASAYMKKVGLNEANKNKLADKKIKKATETKQTVSHETQDRTIQEFSTTKSLTERTSSRDVIEIVQVNGKRSPSPKKTTEKITGILRKPQSPDRMVKSPVSNVQSPERRVQSPVSKVYISERRAHSPERKVYSPVSKVPDGRARSPEHKALSPERKPEHPDRRVISPDRKVTSPVERLHQRTPSPDFKRQKSDTKKETIIKTVYNIEKKIPTKPVQEEKPSWVTNRNLKKMTSETRTFSSKKLETEKPKYRATSPSKVITKPIDVITSSYGPGPLDADGKPLFGIKALRNGASNFQVKGTVIRQEFHSRNGGEPEGTVSVTAYSSQPEELEQLMASQGAEPPSRIHGLSAITTTKKFGGDTGISMTSVNTKEERASLEQFTHTDRKMESHFDKIETCSFEPTEEVISNSRRIESRKSDRTDTSNKRREERVTEVRKEKKEERRDKVERREDKTTVRQSSVKSLTEKFIKSANDSGKTDRSTYPKAGLILRTTSTLRDSVSSDEAHPGLTRSDSEHSMGSVEDVVVRSTERGGTVTTTTRSSRHGPAHQRTSTSTSTSTVTHHQPTVTTTKKTTTVVTGSHEPVITKVVTQGPVTTKVVTSQRQGATVERSFLDSNTKVTGVQDILTRMKNADIVIEDGDTTEDSEARALLNKFLGATVLMAGMQNYVMEQPAGKMVVNQETVRTSTGGSKVTSVRSEDIDLDQCWDERLLRKLLDECTDYEQRRRLRARIRSLMAEQEACASAVTDALGAANITGEADGTGGGSEAREEEEVTVTSSVRRDSSEKTVSSSSTKSSKVTESVSRAAPKPVSPFAKFRQLEKQNSTNSPNSPKSPQSPGSPSQPYFKFTDPALQCSALTIKERLLQWCRDKTRDYENVKLENFSTSWADGLAFCALIHHFLPQTFDYSKLTPERRRHNFTLAFKVADEKAGIYPLLDVDDMVAMRKPDWKCVFTYVQSIYRRFKDQD